MSSLKLISEKSEFIKFLDECDERLRFRMRLALLNEEYDFLLVHIKQLQKRVEILIERFDKFEKF